MIKISDNVNRVFFSGAVLCSAAVLLSACASSGGEKRAALGPNDEPVYLKFDAAGCPTGVKPEVLPLTKSKFVVWQSVEDPNDPNPVPVDASYAIYFDPFKGKPIESNKHGWKRSPQFDQDAPTDAKGVEYKYTIVGDTCLDKPLDPRIRLRR